MFGLSMTFAQLVHLAVLLEFYYMQQGRLTTQKVDATSAAEPSYLANLRCIAGAAYLEHS